MTIYETLPEDTSYTVSPYSPYTSAQVNRFNISTALGYNCILGSIDSLDVISNTGTSILIKTGKCIIDNVLIETDLRDLEEYIEVDLTDTSKFISGENISTETGYYYLCLYYTYMKSRITPVARILIIHPSIISQYSPDSNYLFLKALKVEDVGGNNEVTELLDYDPDNTENQRQYKRNYIEFIGPIPTFTARYTGRLVLSREESGSTLYLGGESEWIALSGTEKKNNIRLVISNTDPSSSDYDYDIGTLWINELTEDIFICVYNTLPGAIWNLWVSSTLNYPDLVFRTYDPYVLEDISEYTIGTWWINTTTNRIYILLNESPIVWKRFGIGQEMIETNFKKYFLI